MTPKFSATINAGRLVFRDKGLVGQWLRSFKVNEELEVIIKKKYTQRSKGQNSFYWVYLGLIAAETGNDADDLHEAFKRMFLPPVFSKIGGKTVRFIGSTRALDPLAMNEYMEKICALTQIPIPPPESVGNIPNVVEPEKKKTDDVVSVFGGHVMQPNTPAARMVSGMPLSMKKAFTLSPV